MNQICSRKRLLNCLLCSTFILSLFLIFTFESCKSPTSPTSNILPDTTSNNYEWQTFILGDGNSSMLNDVTIINDSLAYAVGGIYLKDSTGQNYQLDYNIAKWDGRSWQLKRVAYNIYNYNCTVAGNFFGMSTAIFSFDPNNQFLTDGEDIIDWNETSYSHYPCIDPFIKGALLRIWGANKEKFYVVGRGGTLIYYTNENGYYTNEQGKSIDLGTSTDIFSVWGTTDAKTGETTAYVPVSDLINVNGIKKIFKLNGTQVDSIQWNTGKNVLSVWGTPDGSTMYAAGDGLFENKGNGWEEIPFDTNTRFFEIRGDKSNNIFARGIRLVPPLDEVVAHYNGSSWHEYPELSGFYYYGIAVKGKTVIIVGENGNQAVALIGRRID